MEIERKFLINDLPFDLAGFEKKHLQQAYVSFAPVLRIRKAEADYILTVKGKGHLARQEFERLTRKNFPKQKSKTEA